MSGTLQAVLLPLWPALAGAFGLGLAFGLYAWSERAPGAWARTALILVVVLLASGIATAVLALVPGRPGLWLEVALVLAGAYLAGCAAGSGGRALWGAEAQASTTSDPKA